MENKLFSIITPTYNCKSKIEKTIKSVLNQNKSLYEYIIVDGKSDDGTLDVIKKYESQIKLVVEKDKGVYDAMNKGIDIASGKYLYFLGAGDRLKDGILEKIKALMPEKDLYFIYGNVYMVDRNKVYNGKYNKSKISKSNICHQSIFYNREIFNEIGNYNLKYNILADHAFNIKCFGNDKIKKKYIDYVIADYEGFGLSSKQKDTNFIKDRPKLIKENLGNKVYFIFKIRSFLVDILEKIKLKNKIK